MSDAKKKQSVERCKYSHSWKRIETEPLTFVCDKCGYTPRVDSPAYREAQAILHLREVLKPGDTVYTVLRHVSRSGMSRNIDLYYIRDGSPVWISSYVGHATGSPQSRKNWERSQGLTVGGCGMDMGFHLVYNLSRVLFPNGFVCSGDKCPSNDHSNEYRKFKDFAGQMHTGDGGYALNHKWL